MNTKTLMGVLIVVAVLFSSAVYAGRWYCDDCGIWYGTGASTDALKKFHKETLSMRDELTVKEIELQQEYDKPNPDANRITALRKQIIDLQAKIQVIADRHGISQGGSRGSGMRGQGMMMDRRWMDRGCECW